MIAALVAEERICDLSRENVPCVIRTTEVNDRMTAEFYGTSDLKSSTGLRNL